MGNETGGFLVPNCRLDEFRRFTADPEYELVQVQDDWEIEGKLTVWQWQKIKGGSCSK